MDASHLPEWQCHKTVRAAKIVDIIVTTGPDAYRYLIFSKADSTKDFSGPVDDKVWARFVPAIGDYIVVYADGYISFSPAKPFEDGYTLLRSMPKEAPAQEQAHG